MNAPKLSHLVASVIALVNNALAQTPEWIWHDNKGQAPADNEVRFFRKTFTLEGEVSRALLTFAGDDRAVAFLNGKQVAANRGWNQATTVAVTTEIKPGENLLAIRGQNTSSDADIGAR